MYLKDAKFGLLGLRLCKQYTGLVSDHKHNFMLFYNRNGMTMPDVHVGESCKTVSSMKEQCY